jgi:hypothetical protein
MRRKAFPEKPSKGKTKSFENVSLKQPLLAAHPLCKNSPTANRKGLQRRSAMQWGAVFKDPNFGNWGSEKSKKRLANTSHYFLIFSLMSEAVYQINLNTL